MSSVYVYLGLYILLLLVVSYAVSRRQSKEDYFISGRNRGGWQILASKFAATIGAAYFITYAGFAYEYGLGVFAMLIGMVGGYLIFAYWASPKIHANSKEKKFYTIGDFAYDKTGSVFAKNLLNVLSTLIIFGWTVIGIIGGAKIISDFGFLSYNFAVLLTSGVVLVYILLAGFKAVIITDIIQAVVILVLLVVVTFGVIGMESVPELLSSGAGSVDLGVIIGFFLFGILSVFSYADRYQLCYAAKCKKGLRRGLAIAIVPALFAAFLLLLIGIFMALSVPGLDSSLIFTEALKKFLPASLLPLAIVLFFAGVMSSSDTGVYVVSSHYALSKKDKTVKTIRFAAVFVVITMALLSLLWPDVVDVSILAGGLSLTTSFAMIYLLSGGRKTSRFVGSIFGGLIGFVLGIGILGIEPAAALPTVLGGALGLLWKR